MPAVETVDSTLLVIQYTPRPEGTLREKYAISKGRYRRICWVLWMVGSSEGGVRICREIAWAR